MRTLEEESTRVKLAFAEIYRDQFSKPFLFILMEKHGERHFLCRTPDDLYRVAAHVVIERRADGVYTFQQEANVLGLTESEIVALPAGSVKTEALRQLEYMQRRAHQEKDGLKQSLWADHVAATKDGGVAMLLLRARNQYEYERWDILAFDEVP